MFQTLSPLPEDPIFGLQAAFAADTNPKKVNLGIGSYRDALGNPLVCIAVRKAEEWILKKQLNKEYLPITGDKAFIDQTTKLLFGPDTPRLPAIFGAQTIGGTNALRIGGEFLKGRTLFIPNLTWANHKQIFTRAGLTVESYPYYNLENHTFDFSALCARIKTMAPGSVIVLHGTSHNPTGVNPTLDQWKTLATLLQEQQVLPFFDISYQGFGRGIEEDLQPFRYFVDQKMDLLLAYTYAKTMGLYGERAGAFFIVAQNQSEAQKAGTHIKQIIRSMYSNPPLHSARIVSTVLQSQELKKEWTDELESMRERIDEMRRAFVTGILSKAKDNHYAFMGEGTGFFTFSGISNEQVLRLRQEFGVYLPDGRINLAGLNWNNMDYVINSLLAV